jgi:hypothetical protein
MEVDLARLVPGVDGLHRRDLLVHERTLERSSHPRVHRLRALSPVAFRPQRQLLRQRERHALVPGSAAAIVPRLAGSLEPSCQLVLVDHVLWHAETNGTRPPSSYWRQLFEVSHS